MDKSLPVAPKKYRFGICAMRKKVLEENAKYPIGRSISNEDVDREDKSLCRNRNL